MPCPTCDHTMEGVSSGVWWCPRCGTLRQDSYVGLGTDSQPKLVERCRRFGETLGPSWGALWHRLGIEESINPPKDRPHPM